MEEEARRSPAAMSNFGEQRTKQEVELTRGRRTCMNGGDLLEDARISRGAWKNHVTLGAKGDIVDQRQKVKVVRPCGEAWS